MVPVWQQTEYHNKMLDWLLRQSDSAQLPTLKD
jgi:hypothetical protein